MSEFGKIVFVSRKDLTEGLLLRETSTGLVLENYLDPEHNNIVTIAEFEGVDFGANADFEQIFADARKYVGDQMVTIHVDLNRWFMGK